MSTDMAYGDFKNLPRTKNPKYDEYHRWLDSVVYKYFDKRTSGDYVKSEIMPNQQLAEELRKPIIRKFEKRKVYSPLEVNISSVDLADMQLISKFNKRFIFLLCIIDIYSKYTWVVVLKIKRVLQLLMLSNKYEMNIIVNQIKYG